MLKSVSLRRFLAVLVTAGFSVFSPLLFGSVASAQMHQDSEGRWVNSQGGNLYGDTRTNPNADPRINPYADPRMNQNADPRINPYADPRINPYADTRISPNGDTRISPNGSR
jgi:hypothetical protein